MSLVYERSVRFEEVDAAGIAFFARYFHWCHEAMDNLFTATPGGLAGGYVDLIVRRRIGFPTVHATADWKSPLRFGDRAKILTSVRRIGTTSVTFRFVFMLGDVECAVIEHTCVSTALDTMTKLPLPADCRALLEAHLAPHLTEPKATSPAR